jgi:predicted regulator of Ras-like GTPase activity (Roadblock/LC7/MglB family)
MRFSKIQIGKNHFMPYKSFKQKIKYNLTTMLMKGVRKKSALFKKETVLLEDIIQIDGEPIAELKHEPVIELAPKTSQEYPELKRLSKGKLQMTEMNKVLEKIKGIGGFMAVGTFSPNGEMVAEVNTSGIKLGELGAIANDVLLKAQKATEMMHLGRGQVVHVEAPKAHIICRCLNEATDFAVTASGRAHLHMVLVLDKEDGNVALGKMKLESMIYKVAEYFR